jgi:hypothetical protein
VKLMTHNKDGGNIQGVLNRFNMTALMVLGDALSVCIHSCLCKHRKLG